ncbi:MFS transporter [bacterium]|nr:MFS transporter [bacterium]
MRQLPPKLIIFFTIFIDLVGFGMLIPIIPAYAKTLAIDAHVEGELLGMLMGAFSFMQFLCAPIWGRLSDRIGRRPVLIVSLSGYSLSYLLAAFAPSYGFLLLTRALAGAFGANIATAQAYIADVTPPEERAKGMGLVGAAFGLGFSVGPVIGGLLVGYGFMAPFVAIALLSAGAAGFAFFFLPESLPPERRGKEPPKSLFNFDKLTMAWQHPPVVMLVFLFFLVTFAFANLEVSLYYFSSRRLGINVEHFSFIFAYIGVLGAIVQGSLVGRLVRRMRELATLLVGLVVLSAGLLLITTVHSVPQLLLVLAPVCFGVGLSNPTLLGMISRG